MNQSVTVILNNILSKVTLCILKINNFITPLSILLVCIILAITILITEYISRYRNYNYWDWKKYAVIRIVKAVTGILIFKFVLIFLS